MKHLGSKPCLEEFWSWKKEFEIRCETHCTFSTGGCYKYISSILTANADWNIRVCTRAAYGNIHWCACVASQYSTNTQGSEFPCSLQKSCMLLAEWWWAIRGSNWNHLLLSFGLGCVAILQTSLSSLGPIVATEPKVGRYSWRWGRMAAGHPSSFKPPTVAFGFGMKYRHVASWPGWSYRTRAGDGRLAGVSLYVFVSNCSGVTCASCDVVRAWEHTRATPNVGPTSSRATEVLMWRLPANVSHPTWARTCFFEQHCPVQDPASDESRLVRPWFRANDTVDGRNPAAVDMINILLFTGFHTSQVVVWDFFLYNYI